MRDAKSLALLLLVGVAFSACRSSGRVSVSQQDGGADPLAPFVGRKLILRHFGDRREAVAKPGENRKGTCDVAVQVTSATAVSSGVRFVLKNYGPVHVGESAAGRCDTLAPEVALTLKGVHAGTPAEWRDFFGTLLLSPEDYVAARGKKLTDTPAAEPKAYASRAVAADAESRALGRAVTAWPKPLLSVEPSVSVPGGKVRQQSEIEFTAVVGTDGRPYKAQVKTPLSEEHQKHVTSVLGMWRFEPAKEGEKVVAALYEGRTVLSVH